MGRGSRPKVRWANDRRRKKKARDRRQQPEARAAPATQRRSRSAG